jgi:hypothetical protein
VVLTPQGPLAEGAAATVRVGVEREATGRTLQSITARLANDHVPPTVSLPYAQPDACNSGFEIRLTAQDETAWVKTAQLFYSIDSAPPETAYAGVFATIDCAATEFLQHFGPLPGGFHTITYEVEVRDGVGQATRTGPHTAQFFLDNLPPTSVSLSSDVKTSAR